MSLSQKSGFQYACNNLESGMVNCEMFQNYQRSREFSQYVETIKQEQREKNERLEIFISLEELSCIYL